MDLDGTLLNSENKISPKTIQVLTALEKQGVTLILASGRSYTRLLGYARQLQMDRYGGYLIEIDGVALYETRTGKRRKFHEMPPEEIGPVFDWLTGQDAESQALFDDGMFVYIPPHLYKMKEQLRKQQNVPEDFPWTAGPWNWLSDFRDGYPHLSYIESAAQIDRPINKLQIMHEEEPLARLFEKLQARFGQDFAIYRTTPRQLEVLPGGFSKGAAMERLMETNGWHPDEVAVFGDGENDVSMFEKSDCSFAMANARDYVRSHARYLAGDHDEDGIVQGLAQIGLPEPEN